MRSRYSAFALAEVGYLLETWHQESRPPALQLDPRIRWIGLDILGGEQCPQQATVEFEARLLASGEVSAMCERSEFVFQHGRWLYTRGEQLPPSVSPWKPGRNQHCPCGSGNKFKRCCGRSGEGVE